MMDTMRTNNEPTAESKMSEEISHEEALKLLFTDEDLCDVSLQGADGKLVGASRTMLSARSPVFRKMLVGYFSEASSPVVSVGYSSTVLRAVVEYIITNTASILQIDDDKLPSSFTSDTATMAETLVELAAAAMFFGLPNLCQLTQEVCIKYIKAKPCMAVCFWQGFKNHEAEIPSKLAIQQAREMVHTSPDKMLEENGLSIITSSLLEDILRDDEMRMSELTRFKIIQKWVESIDNDVGSRIDDGKHLIQFVKLECINPSNLSEIVAPSGLVPMEQLMEAYKSQAMCAMTKHNVTFDVHRFVTVWESSGSVLFGHNSGSWLQTPLQVPPVRTGIHKWIIEVERRTQNMILGISLRATGTSSPNPVRSEYLGSDNYSWGLRYDGNSYHATRTIATGHPNYGTGSKIAFILDLRPAGGGTLNASIDGGRSFQIFTDLRSHLSSSTSPPSSPTRGGSGSGGTNSSSNHQIKGFVPAASTTSGRVRVVSGPTSWTAG